MTNKKNLFETKKFWISIIGIVVSLFIPEVRCFLGIEKNCIDGTSAPPPTPSPTLPPKITILMGWLYVYPENIGTFRNAPIGVIEGINNQNMYGYSDWRLPTKEELDVIGSNASKFSNLPVNKYYLGYNSSSYLPYVTYNLKKRKIVEKDGKLGSQFKRDVEVRLVRTEDYGNGQNRRYR